MHTVRRSACTRRYLQSRHRLCNFPSELCRASNGANFGLKDERITRIVREDSAKVGLAVSAHIPAAPLSTPDCTVPEPHCTAQHTAQHTARHSTPHIARHSTPHTALHSTPHGAWRMTHCTVAGPHCTPHNTLYSTLNTAQNTARHTEATSLERTSYTGQHTSHTAQRTSYTAQRTTLAQQCCSTAMPLCSQQTQFNTNPHCGRFEVVDSTPHCLTATLVNWTPHHSAPAEDTTHTPHWALGTGHWVLGAGHTGHWALGTGYWALDRHSGQLDNWTPQYGGGAPQQPRARVPVGPCAAYPRK